MYRKSIQVVVKTRNKSSLKILVPEKIYKMLDSNQQLSLKVGMMELDVKCGKNITQNNIKVPRHIAKKMGLYDGMEANLTVKNNKLCLGPVIGVFVSNGQVRKANSQKPIFRLVELMRANKEAKAILYWFSVKDVDFNKKIIHGTYYHASQKRWRKSTFPFPDVLYDRGGGTLSTQQTISNKIRRNLETNKELIRINPTYYFDKFEVYERLKNHKEIEAYLPHTVLYKNQDDLQAMFEVSSTVYIKDCLGNNGVGVGRIKKQFNNNYEYSYYKDHLCKVNFDSFSDLVKELNDLTNGKKFLLQNAIDVMEADNGNVDLRATVQRNREGQLVVGACPVRVGIEGSPVTSTKSGALVYCFDDFFREELNFKDEDIVKLRKRTEEFLLEICRYIEIEYGTFGDIGIDFAIDKSQNFWFIECNAKPGKDALYCAYDDETVKEAFLNPLEYGKYLWE
ncbi:YheC/YheD family protein [Bacillus shivajii]|uniref:YheC/YheD family endospore coat-associated protein n=1 Tax=Bacillus shivajii TaxID=1983719 RepID=UPI001CFB2984|nr:YheC/YheD family protein [Bacillus shivajii]UCZ52610.1 YheC/YheD family protein [Bacillus shivajii]